MAKHSSSLRGWWMPEGALLAIFVTSLMVGYSGAMMLGSLLTINITETVKHGFWAGPRVISGHAIAEAAIVLALAFGFSTFLRDRLISGTRAPTRLIRIDEKTFVQAYTDYMHTFLIVASYLSEPT